MCSRLLLLSTQGAYIFLIFSSLLFWEGTYDKKRVFPEKPYEDKRKAKVYGDRAKFAITSLPNPLEFFGYVRTLLLRLLLLPVSRFLHGILIFEIPSNVLCRLPVVIRMQQINLVFRIL
jgi:hypothetical protein